jgi:hypothetical protein
MARRALRSESRWAALALLLGCVAVLGCDGAYVNLGNSAQALNGGDGGGGGSGGAAGDGATGAVEAWEVSQAPLIAQVDMLQLANPTLTGDQEHLYYTQQLRGGDDPHEVRVMHAVRTGDGFGGGAPVILTNDAFGEASPAISADRSELWFSRFADVTGSDVWRATRAGDAWSGLERVAELCSDFDDAARPPGLGGSVMPLSSKRHGGKLYQIYFAMRGADGTWATPNQEHLSNVNSKEALSADGFLSADGLSLYFASTRSGGADLYVAHRSSLDADFGVPEALTDLNSDYDERMPWVSADERTVYFASNRPGAYEQYGLYVAKKRAR